MKKVFSTVKGNILPILLGFATLWLRLIGLGYSDYQGDEIKALFLPDPTQPISNFLLTQRKGPIQFLVTFILKIFDPTYSSRFFMRLPFAIAGILTVYFFYRLVEMHFSKRAAFFGAFFLATNGFFVAFSRIIQYQAFVIFFMVLSLYFFTLSSKKEGWKIKGLYLGFISWALSCLSHYDGIFIAPFVFYTIYKWVKTYNIKTIKEFLRFFSLPGLISALLLASFYIPFVLEISKSTLSYWQGRITSTGGKISSSKYLFTVYQPIYVIHIYSILVVLGTASIFLKVINYVKQKNFEETLLYIGIGFWFIVPFIFLEVFVDIPGTHVYTYLISTFLVLGLGIDFIYKYFVKVLGKFAFAKFLFWLGTMIIFSFIFLQSNQIFVEHQTEYPWESEKFLAWELTQPTPAFHLSMFGFPYYRHWNEIGDFIEYSENNGYYSTNERKSIARYHISLKKDTKEAGYFIYIKNPQSFTNNIIYEKANYWAKNYQEILSFYKNGKSVAKIYSMPKGSLEEIQAQGY